MEAPSRWKLAGVRVAVLVGVEGVLDRVEADEGITEIAVPVAIDTDLFVDLVSFGIDLEGQSQAVIGAAVDIE